MKPSPDLRPLAVAAALLLAACGKPDVATEAGPPPLAVVGGVAILPADLLAEIAWRESNSQFVPEPGLLLEQMVTRLATVQRAQKAKLDQDPDTKRRIESQLISRLRETTLDKQIREIQITEADVEAAYQARIEQFTRKALDRFAILFQAAPAKASDARRDESRERLEAARKLALQNPAPGGRGPAASGFGMLAVDHSEDQASRYRGGDIGWIEAAAPNTRFPAEVLAAGAKLEPGAVSEVIATDEGYYLIRKTETRPGGVVPLAEVTDELRQSLLRERRSALELAFVAETRAAAAPQIHPAALAAMNLPPSPPPRPAPDQPPVFPGVSTAP